MMAIHADGTQLLRRGLGRATGVPRARVSSSSMTMPKALPAQEQVPGLPLDQLAMHVLWWHVDQRGSQSRKGFLAQRESEAARARQDLGGVMVTSSGSVRGPAAQAWQEAYEWLIHHGLLTADVTQSGDFWMPSRLGLDVARDVQGLARMRASARLDVDLHPSIAGRIGSQFLLGEYELAAFAAMRQVEIRVRELAGAATLPLVPGEASVSTALTNMIEARPQRASGHRRP
jgi:hypothetical protein